MGREKQATKAWLTENAVEGRGCSESPDAFAGSDDEVMNDSDWEECPIPNMENTVNHWSHDMRGLSIEFDDVPDAKRQKRAYRATAEDKERAELVHKVHLLCLIARGRIVDHACDNRLIQASLLSLLPPYLSKVSSLTRVSVKDIAPLLRWFRGIFSVRGDLNPATSFKSSLASALESRHGTAEELAALTVALFRALNLTTRFVSILDVASLKPGVDKDEPPGQKNNKLKQGIFSTSTLMVAKDETGSASLVKSSPFNENKTAYRTSVRDPSKRKDGCSTSTDVQFSRLTSSKHQSEHTSGSDGLKDQMADISSDGGSSSKAGRTKNRGDIELEMQLAMALTATAVASNQHNNKTDTKNRSTSPADVTSPPKGSKRIDDLPLPGQVISTAVGSKKVGSPLYWAEVYCNGENMDGKWVHVDAVNGLIDAEHTVEAAAAACKTFLRYVVAFAGGGAKDVTRRYCLKWHKIATKRVNSLWWDSVLAPLKQLESHSTGGSANVGKEPPDAPNINSSEDAAINSNNQIHVNESSSCSSSIVIRSALEDMELATRALTEPLPTSQQAYKKHELYAIEKWLNKNQILHPKGPVLGFCSGHPVYPRTCVQTLRTKESWLREGLQIKANEVPLKILKRSLKIKKVENFEDGDKRGEGSTQCMELYGRWQLEPFCLPHAVNGIVPKNERGQVDMWSEKCLPPGTVHLRLPRIFWVAKRLGIDYAPAMVGFDYKGGRATPLYDGIVVCAEFKDAILEAYAEEQERREAEEKRQKEAQAASRWYQLLSSILTRERLKNSYVDANKFENTQTSKADAKSSQANVEVVEEPKPSENQNRSGSKRQWQRERSGGERWSSVNRSVGEWGSHEHEFVAVEESFDGESLVRRKRCRCGFTVQTEQL